MSLSYISMLNIRYHPQNTPFLATLNDPTHILNKMVHLTQKFLPVRISIIIKAYHLSSINITIKP